MPAVLTQSMGVALYALLLAILMPELKTSLRSLVLAVASGFFNWFLVMVDLLPKGWSIIVCIFVVASAGVFFNPGFVKEENIHYSKKSWTRFVNLLSNYINEQIGRS
jgi:predicted branched-subunit amino acid permease